MRNREYIASDAAICRHGAHVTQQNRRTTSGDATRAQCPALGFSTHCCHERSQPDSKGGRITWRSSGPRKIFCRRVIEVGIQKPENSIKHTEYIMLDTEIFPISTCYTKQMDTPFSESPPWPEASLWDATPAAITKGRFKIWQWIKYGVNQWKWTEIH